MIANTAQQASRRRDKACIITVAAIALLIVAMGGGFRSDNPAETPRVHQSIPERIQAAVAAQHSCTPALKHIHLAIPGDTSAGYNVGCGRWIYYALVPSPRRDKGHPPFQQVNGQ